jgi:hypothetical protein
MTIQVHARILRRVSEAKYRPIPDVQRSGLFPEVIREGYKISVRQTDPDTYREKFVPVPRYSSGRGTAERNANVGQRQCVH